MRWLKRSVLLCLVIVVVTPAPADAWFEWLDRLSGPGRWYGAKVDVRAACFGTEMPPPPVVRKRPQDNWSGRISSEDPIVTQRAAEELRTTLTRLREINGMLQVLKRGELDDLDQEFSALMTELATIRRTPRLTQSEVKLRQESAAQQFEAEWLAADNALRTAATFSVIPGIFISLCPSGKVRSIALEFGFTGLTTGGSDKYATGERIWMTTVTGGLSYRVPLPVSRDFIDLGTNVGAYRFYSDGFEHFSGLTIEPYIDLHLPTSFRMSRSATERFFGRFTVRSGLQFFPGGFEATQFAAQPGTPDIAGREASASVTVFFALK